MPLIFVTRATFDNLIAAFLLHVVLFTSWFSMVMLWFIALCWNWTQCPLKQAHRPSKMFFFLFFFFLGLMLQLLLIYWKDGMPHVLFCLLVFLSLFVEYHIISEYVDLIVIYYLMKIRRRLEASLEGWRWSNQPRRNWEIKYVKFWRKLILTRWVLLY